MFHVKILNGSFKLFWSQITHEDLDLVQIDNAGCILLLFVFASHTVGISVVRFIISSKKLK